MRCPGQDTQFWNQSAIFEAPCPKCAHMVEFFKDDTTRKCGSCGHRFVNPRMDFGCAAYCSFAEQCLGDLPPELVAQKEDLLKDRVAVAVKRFLKSDFKRIGRAARRARHAEHICQAEKGNLAAVLMAAYLWDLDAGNQDSQNLPAARAILSDLKAPEPLIEKVCAIIAQQHGGSGDIGEHRVVADSAAIADLEEAIKEDPSVQSSINRHLQETIKSQSGQSYARELFQQS
ncbi:MAG: hypothetical protein VR64_04550 [Desulfatitalea sp. BRH_c12]|nr:MAG: hypothetical protein VR64_04550 [Desulfatitalea sp. BRH_c12]